MIFCDTQLVLCQRIVKALEVDHECELVSLLHKSKLLLVSFLMGLRKDVCVHYVFFTYEDYVAACPVPESALILPVRYRIQHSSCDEGYSSFDCMSAHCHASYSLLVLQKTSR